MNRQFSAFKAEIYKNRHSKITWISFAAFSIAPIMGALFMILMKDQGMEGMSGTFKMKAQMLSFAVGWGSYLELMCQAVGVGGVLVFGFVASWIFGREFSDGTAKDLLALPISRTRIINAKFIYYIIWCFAIVLANMAFALVLGFLLNLPGWSNRIFMDKLEIYLVTTILIVMVNAPVAFFAVSAKGYLAPLGFAAIALVLAQVIGAAGFGNYFPWSIPGLYSGSAGELRDTLNMSSYLLIFITAIAGYLLTVSWWRLADQTK